MCVVFGFSVFFVVVCTIFICAVFLWVPEHLSDLGLDLGDEREKQQTTKGLAINLLQQLSNKAFLDTRLVEAVCISKC